MQDPLTEQIIAAAIEVHRLLGPGLLESIYEQALCVELTLRGLKVEQQVYLRRHSESVSKLPDVALAQALSYLRATGLQRGLLINFGLSRLIDGLKRVSL